MSAVATGLVLGGVGGLLGVGDANRQNRAARRSFEARQRSRANEARSLDQDAALRLERNRNAQRRVEAQITVDSAARGVGFGGSTRALQLSSDVQAAINDAVIVNNRTTGRVAIETGLEADRVALRSRMVSPGFAGVSGAVGGFQTGLSLGSAVDTLLEPEPKQSTRTPRGATR